MWVVGGSGEGGREEGERNAKKHDDRRGAIVVGKNWVSREVQQGGGIYASTNLQAREYN